VPALIVDAQAIVKRMTGNASFPNPTPTLGTLALAIDELRLAETAALARTKGAVATRNEKRTASRRHALTDHDERPRVLEWRRWRSSRRIP
jgi:hypothetical protein